MRNGRKPKELAEEFGCDATSIRTWIREAESKEQKLSQNEREELIQLRQRLRQVQIERDILAKATAWFAGNTSKSPNRSTLS